MPGTARRPPHPAMSSSSSSSALDPIFGGTPLPDVLRVLCLEYLGERWAAAHGVAIASNNVRYRMSADQPTSDMYVMGLLRAAATPSPEPLLFYTTDVSYSKYKGCEHVSDSDNDSDYEDDVPPDASDVVIEGDDDNGDAFSLSLDVRDIPFYELVAMGRHPMFDQRACPLSDPLGSMSVQSIARKMIGSPLYKAYAITPAATMFIVDMSMMDVFDGCPPDYKLRTIIQLYRLYERCKYDAAIIKYGTRRSTVSPNDEIESFLNTRFKRSESQLTPSAVIDHIVSTRARADVWVSLCVFSYQIGSLCYLKTLLKLYPIETIIACGANNALPHQRWVVNETPSQLRTRSRRLACEMVSVAIDIAHDRQRTSRQFASHLTLTDWQFQGVLPSDRARAQKAIDVAWQQLFDGATSSTAFSSSTAASRLKLQNLLEGDFTPLGPYISCSYITGHTSYDPYPYLPNLFGRGSDLLFGREMSNLDDPNDSTKYTICHIMKVHDKISLIRYAPNISNVAQMLYKLDCFSYTTLAHLVDMCMHELLTSSNRMSSALPGMIDIIDILDYLGFRSKAAASLIQQLHEGTIWMARYGGTTYQHNYNYTAMEHLARYIRHVDEFFDTYTRVRAIPAEYAVWKYMKDYAQMNGGVPTSKAEQFASHVGDILKGYTARAAERIDSMSLDDARHTELQEPMCAFMDIVENYSNPTGIREICAEVVQKFQVFA
jgi:hypothetical protein